MQIISRLLGTLERTGNWLKEKFWERIPEGVRFMSMTIAYFGLSYWCCSLFIKDRFPSFGLAGVNLLLALVLYVPIRDWIIEGRRIKQKRLEKLQKLAKHPAQQ